MRGGDTMDNIVMMLLSEAGCMLNSRHTSDDAKKEVLINRQGVSVNEPLFLQILLNLMQNKKQPQNAKSLLKTYVEKKAGGEKAPLKDKRVDSALGIDLAKIHPELEAIVAAMPVRQCKSLNPGDNSQTQVIKQPLRKVLISNANGAEGNTQTNRQQNKNVHRDYVIAGEKKIMVNPIEVSKKKDFSGVSGKDSKENIHVIENQKSNTYKWENTEKKAEFSTRTSKIPKTTSTAGFSVRNKEGTSGDNKQIDFVKPSKNVVAKSTGQFRPSYVDNQLEKPLQNADAKNQSPFRFSHMEENRSIKSALFKKQEKTEAKNLQSRTDFPTENSKLIQNRFALFPASKAQQADLTGQIVRKIKVMMEGSQSKMEVHLKPEHLGRVEIHLISKEGVLSARVITENGQTANLLQAGFQQIKETLEQQGIKLHDFGVDVGGNQEQAGYPDGEGNEFGQQNFLFPSGRGQPEGEVTVIPVEDDPVRNLHYKLDILA